MNEMKTTAVFAAIAALSLGGAWIVRPKAIRSESEITGDLKGQAIFKELDPANAASFRIVKFNEEIASLSQLELAKDSNTEVWSLPSADGYPADSAEKVSQAIAPLSDLVVLSTVSTDRGDHSMYGVVEPKEDQLEVSSTGVGTLLRIGGKKGEVLGELIIGKAVDGFPEQRYVRVPTQDAVYIVELKPDVYSTQFDTWIKGEILTVRSMDINYVGLRDYAIVPVENAYGIAKNFDADLAYNDNKWALSKFVDHKVEGSPETNLPPEGKVLADSALNDLRNSVQNLKIVSVRRKPAGLAQDLKADESLLKNKESTKSLQNQGFFPMESKEVLSAGGELIVGTKEGIRYLLRFGNATISTAALEDEKKEKDGEKKDDEASVSSRRYLLVTAQLDESIFPVPELKIVPETVEQMLEMEAAEKAKAEGLAAPKATEGAAPEGIAPADAAPADAAPGDAAPGDAKPSDAAPANEAAKPAEPSKDAPAVENSSPSTEATPTPPSTENPGEPAPAAGDAPKALSSSDEQSSSNRNAAGKRAAKLVSVVQDEAKADAPQPAQQSDQQAQQPTQQSAAPTQTTPAQTTPAAAAPQAGGQTELAPSRKETREELEERLQFLQESIKKENKRALDARNDAIKAAKKKVDELNAGFADWYYVVSESVYTKLRVNREQLFKAPDAVGAKPGAEGPAFPPNFGLPPGN